MSLFSKRERDIMKKSFVFRDSVLNKTFDLVTYFYPRQILTIFIDARDIENMMDCDSKKANKLLEKIRTKMGRGPDEPIRLSDFCEYKNVCDMLMQVFLTSFSKTGPRPVRKRIDAPVAYAELRSFEDFCKELNQGILPTDDVLRHRLALWHEQHPRGERMFARKSFYRVMIRTHEIAQVCGCCIDTARKLLRVTLKEAGYPKSRSISIQKFCELNFIPEEDARKAIARMHGDDDYDNDNDND